MKQDGEKRIYKKDINKLHNPGFDIEFKDERNVVLEITLVNRFDYINIILMFVTNLLSIHSKSVDSTIVDKYFDEFVKKKGEVKDVIVTDNNYAQQEDEGNEQENTNFDDMFSSLLKMKKSKDEGEDEESGGEEVEREEGQGTAAEEGEHNKNEKYKKLE